MSTYGRNFEFRVQPHQGQRASRYITGAANIPFGAPVAVNVASGVDANGRLKVELASGAVGPRTGMHGLAMFEWGPRAFEGVDPNLTTYSDRDYAPAATPVYLVSGAQVEFALRNTEDRSFYGQHTYLGRKMVAGLAGSTPTVAVGDLLRPHSSPSDANGYWQETSTASEAWLVVTWVSNNRSECQARFLF